MQVVLGCLFSNLFLTPFIQVQFKNVSDRLNMQFFFCNKHILTGLSWQQLLNTQSALNINGPIAYKQVCTNTLFR